MRGDTKSLATLAYYYWSHPYKVTTRDHNIITLGYPATILL